MIACSSLSGLWIRTSVGSSRVAAPRSRSVGPIRAWLTISSRPSPARMRRTRCRGSLGSGRYGGRSAAAAAPGCARSRGRARPPRPRRRPTITSSRCRTARRRLSPSPMPLDLEAERSQQRRRTRVASSSMPSSRSIRGTSTATRRRAFGSGSLSTMPRADPGAGDLGDEPRRAVGRAAAAGRARSPSRGACSPPSAGRAAGRCCGSSARGRSPTRGSRASWPRSTSVDAPPMIPARPIARSRSAMTSIRSSSSRSTWSIVSSRSPVAAAAHDDPAAGDRIGVVGVHRLPELVHDVVRDVDDRADRPHPGRRRAGAASTPATGRWPRRRTSAPRSAG